ncbi:MAG: hypothetical protein R3240_06185, partial [Gammaproteobacteria bacterium]|nr:hypothetical protein [Gammaproteobacteria bacterium]
MDDKLSAATKITAILTSISLVIGIVLGLLEIKDSLSMAKATMQKANETLDAIKVESLSNVIDILDVNYKIRTQQVIFDQDRFAQQINKAK